MKMTQSNLLLAMKRRKIVAENALVKLIEQKRDHKTWYELHFIGMNLWLKDPLSTETEIRSHFGESFGTYAMKYRFWNRIEAEKQFSYATLRWG
jgi:hypothetical protein